MIGLGVGLEEANHCRNRTRSPISVVDAERERERTRQIRHRLRAFPKQPIAYGIEIGIDSGSRHSGVPPHLEVLREVPNEIGVARAQDRVLHFGGPVSPELHDLGISLRDIRNVKVRAIGQRGPVARCKIRLPHALLVTFRGRELKGGQLGPSAALLIERLRRKGPADLVDGARDFIVN